MCVPDRVRSLFVSLQAESRGALNSYICVELKKFLPQNCSEYLPAAENEPSAMERLLGAADPAPKKRDNGRRLDFASWLLAFDRYALAAAIVRPQQMPYTLAMQHKANVRFASFCCTRCGKRSACVPLQVARVAIDASAENRSCMLGVLYDEVCRKHWEESAGRLGDDFDISVAAGI